MIRQHVVYVIQQAEWGRVHTDILQDKKVSSDRSREYCAIKIGKTDNLSKRVKCLQTGNPVKLFPIAYKPCKDRHEAARLEECCHYNLGNFKLEGEWFLLADLVAQAIVVSGFTLLPQVGCSVLYELLTDSALRISQDNNGDNSLTDLLNRSAIYSFMGKQIYESRFGKYEPHKPKSNLFSGVGLFL